MSKAKCRRKDLGSLRSWLTEPVSEEVEKSLRRLTRAKDVRHVAVMPDVHLAGSVCIGTVVATNRLIYPQAVGADIGCGMAAVAFDCSREVLNSVAVADRMLARLREKVPIMRQRCLTTAPSLSASLTGDSSLSDVKLAAAARREGRIEMGTLGRGNHFLEFQTDEDERLWMMVHSGSRVMGQIITEHHLHGATRTTGGLMWLDSESDAGHAYLADIDWARRYARANRQLILEQAARVAKEVLSVEMLADSLVQCDHNHIRRERHFGQDLWVHRKGAISAVAGEAGIIPGSMATWSYHVTGRGCSESLCSSSHGAGRAMSRVEARRRISVDCLHDQLAGVCFDHRNAKGLCEEAPAAYKDVEKVMRAQRKLTRVLRRLRPLLNYKGV